MAEIFWLFWEAPFLFLPYARMRMNTYEYFAVKKLCPLAPSFFLSHTTYKQSPFRVEIMRLRVVAETMKPQGTQSLLGNTFWVLTGGHRYDFQSGAVRMYVYKHFAKKTCAALHPFPSLFFYIRTCSRFFE